MQKRLAVAMVVLSLGVLPACATKKFVRAEVGSVNEKVDTLGTSLEETQERTRQSDARIGAVDVKAEAAARSAADAGTAAAAAGTAASAATTATKEVDTRLSGRVDGVETAARRLVYEVTLSEAEGNFTSGDSVLPDDAKVRLDQMVTKLMTESKNVVIEIEGHTDNRGALDYNERLGLERADAVKRYLHMHHKLPLHKINVISYGESEPAVPNNTRAGRSQNRRVVVRVLS